MESKAERLRSRNKQVRDYFEELERKNPKWKYSELLKDTAERFPPLSTTTVAAIINRKGAYAD